MCDCSVKFYLKYFICSFHLQLEGKKSQKYKIIDHVHTISNCLLYRRIGLVFFKLIQPLLFNPEIGLNNFFFFGLGAEKFCNPSFSKHLWVFSFDRFSNICDGHASPDFWETKCFCIKRADAKNVTIFFGSWHRCIFQLGLSN